MKPRVTVSMCADGSFEIWLNEAGRDLLVKELQGLNPDWEHFHLDHYTDPNLEFATDIPLSVIPYRDTDTCLERGKVLFRLDAWDREHYSHVLG